MTELGTQAEKAAELAENLPAFSGLKLLHTKRELTELLSLIGRGDIFDEYTKHDISHVNEMLRMLDWVITEKTRTVMTPADWLLIVLSIYFHDLGMLVTKSEYKARDSSAFRSFCENVLFVGTEGSDYKAKIAKNYPDERDRERFLYQEFVRHNHAARIRSWIAGEAEVKFGVSTSMAKIVADLLAQLSETFKRDLAFVCESHHLEDLGDTRKYQTSVPYGNSIKETANVQFAAIILRTADLLHITRDRTPAVMYRAISPSDPISQREWAKHGSVTSVRPQPLRLKEKDEVTRQEQDTVEVHALFTNADGFFGLTSYLSYADQQLKKSHDWAKAAKKTHAVTHEFPWRSINDDHVEARGFMPQPFSFELDQAKILDLLTGHTLYNDTGVVLRELVQNSLDAVRLQSQVDQLAAVTPSAGKVDITWDSNNRVLTVTDNGTGMTQRIIEDHLLRVGSSRYRDPEFQKKFPGFSAISRFGIGVLSCFMIADEVEIVTVHPDEAEARHLSLRSVHGKYLIRLLNKSSDPRANSLGPHGTAMSLTLRPSARMNDVVAIARDWIVFPEASVRVTVDGRRPVVVGFPSPKAALIHILTSTGYSPFDGDAETSDPSGKSESLTRAVKVVQRSEGAVTLAYALEWSEYFREWSFVNLGSTFKARYERDDKPPFFLGTSIEGIRVERYSPGFADIGIAAIANTSGPYAPTTNVARSLIEATPEQIEMLKAIYKIYAAHVKTELEALYENRGFSLSWAVQEARYVIRPLLDAGGPAGRLSLLVDELRQLPLFLVEEGGTRKIVSALELDREESLWTIDSLLLESAEHLLKEIPSSSSLSQIMESLGASLTLPDGPLLASSGSHDIISHSVFEGREVAQISISRRLRSVELQWKHRTAKPHWKRPPIESLRDQARRMNEAYDFEARRTASSTHPSRLFIGVDNIPIKGAMDEIGVRAQSATFLFSGTPLADYLVKLIDHLNDHATDDDKVFGLAAFEMVSRYVPNRKGWPRTEEQLTTFLNRLQPRLSDRADAAELVSAILSTNGTVFDPWAWRRDQP